ncbi:4-(cytidine 5'-diphospho)-2-C-methyl-D-erythritol kinase, partial [Rhodovulum visakhapatnamense]|nr:4-(cytidine 5'-diphospho)-2-C-methyl-D-erythritol kinase [Rhodovulum visakhapatnamense]
ILAALWGRDLPGPEAVLSLGADVPVCLAPGPVRMRGVGEEILPAPALPEFGLLLVNPGVEVPTPAVFKGLVRKNNAPMPELPGWASAADLADWLAGQRNDLEPPARAEAPVIDAVLAAIAATPGCLLARMSGSGATCFGIYADRAAAERAAALLRETRPDWWAEAGAPYSL